MGCGNSKLPRVEEVTTGVERKRTLVVTDPAKVTELQSGSPNEVVQSASPAATDAEAAKNASDYYSQKYAVKKSPSQVAEAASQNTEGLYVKYSEARNGTLQGVWSRKPVEGALAYCIPGRYTTIPEYKYNKPFVFAERISEGTPAYLKAWGLFFRECRNIDGEVTLLIELSDLEVEKPQNFPSFNVFILKGSKVVRVPRTVDETPQKIMSSDAICVAPAGFPGFEPFADSGNICTPQMFSNTARAKPENVLVAS